MSDQFTRASCSVAVAQLIEAAGFDSAQSSSLEIITDLLIRYISHLGGAAHTYAETAGRTVPNAFDLAAALDEMGISIKDLQQYADAQGDLPFAQPIPEYPIQKTVPHKPSFIEQGEQAPAHIPAFLPAFPDPHTLKASAYYAQPRPAKETLPKQQQEGEEALERLEARMQPKSELLATMLKNDHNEEEPQKKAFNPYLEAPAWESMPSGRQQEQAGTTTNQVEQVEWQAVAQEEQPAPLLPDGQFAWAWSGPLKKDGYENEERGRDGSKRRVEDILAMHAEELEAGMDEDFIVGPNETI